MRLLIRFMFVFVAVLAALSMIRSALSPQGRENRERRTSGPAQERTGRLMKDPVCGTYVTISNAPLARRDDETFYFCSEECREKFLAT